MSQQLIQQYLNQLSDLRKASGTGRDGVVSEAFKDLLKGHANVHDLIFIPQYELPKQDGNIIDGALVYQLRVPFGYWEKVIDLLTRVTRVSVETMEIVEAMKKEKR